jgi:hypothetical protein
LALHRGFTGAETIDDRARVAGVTAEFRDELSVLLLPKGQRASKTIAPPLPGDPPEKLDVKSYKGFLWRYLTMDFAGFDDFCTVLHDLEDAGRAIIVRGEAIPGVDISKPIIRRKDDHGDGLGVTLREKPNGQRWMLGDIDNWPNPSGKPADAAAMRALTYKVFTSVMPARFHDVYYWYQWSNSMGVGRTADWSVLKLHFWILLERPVTDTVIGQWAADIDGLDASVFRTIQPNYIAGPAFRGGMTDPLPGQRSGAVKEYGTKERVSLEYDYEPPALHEARATACVRTAQAVWRQEAPAHRYINVDTASAPMCRIAAIGVNGRLHGPIIASAASWITCCGRDPDYAAWVALVRAQVELSGHPEAYHRGSERYLRQAWDSAQRKFSPLNPENPPVPRELIINKNRF